MIPVRPGGHLRRAAPSLKITSEDAGYAPGIYVGDSPGLTAKQLYRDLAFRHYWGAYNVNADQEPIRRGWQLKQRVGTAGTVAGISTETYDDDVTRTDRLGGRPLWLTNALLG